MAAMARMHFHALSCHEQAQAIRDLAASGQGKHTIADATGLSVEQVRRVLAQQEAA
jgi:DNA invertase Pin-like site-specific DNA recombinase